jgi:hypothetical protein
MHGFWKVCNSIVLCFILKLILCLLELHYAKITFDMALGAFYKQKGALLGEQVQEFLNHQPSYTDVDSIVCCLFHVLVNCVSVVVVIDQSGNII